MGARRALIVATGSYDNQGLRRLGSPAHDADALRTVLADPELGGFEVTVVRDQPSHRIRREIADFLAAAVRDDVLLLHFSCHGLKNAAGELYLAGTDTLPTRLGATGVPARFVNDELAECRAAHVALLLDCCYGGAFDRGSVARSSPEVNVADSFPLRPGRSRVVITASSATEYAFEGEDLAESGQLRPSVFTGAIVAGLSSGDADLNGDGEIDLDELYKYVYTKVTATTAHQTPHQSGGGHGASLVVAKAPLSRRVPVGEVPADLVAKARDTDPTVRLSAIGGLRTLLVGDDIPVAAAALTFVRELTTDDSVSVRGSALEAIAVAQLRPSPAVVDLGEGGEQVVALAGPPLAREFNTSTEIRWLRVERADGGLRVSADPAAFPEGYGELRGGVVVRSPLGDVTIPVVCRPSARLWSRAAIPTPDRAWFDDWRVLVGAAVLLTVVTIGVSGSMIASSTVLGVGYYLLRFVPLFVGIRLLDRDGPNRVIGHAFVTANAVYLITDAFSDVHNAGSVFGWLQLAAAVAFTVVLAVRWWPFEQVPRKPRLVSPTRRPLAWVAIGATALELLLLVAGFPTPDGTFTIGGVNGMIGGLLAVVPWAGLCVLAVLAQSLNSTQRLFAVAAVLAYAVPEVYFMLGSLLLGGHFTYVGDDVWSSDGAAAWFVLLHALSTAVLAGSTASIVWKRFQ